MDGEKQAGHVPVLLEEAIEFLAVRRGGTYIDATVGLGGHSYEIAKRLGAPGHLIGFDKDAQALERARRCLQPSPEQAGDWPRVTLLHASFAEVERAGEADGLLADLGVSSLQLQDPGRGFSFQAEGPLDMRMDAQGEVTADQVVNRMDEKTLADVIYEFGEERRSRRIARAIVRSRPIHSTTQLAEVISAAARPMNSGSGKRISRARQGPGRRFGEIHPATRTFQAIRIFVNRELDDLRALLSDAASPRVLKAGGRLVVISFHSLEDRMVKDALRAEAQAGTYRLLTRKPVRASADEIRRNPRSRSARLRAAEKL